MDLLAGEADALAAELEEERFRNVAGMEPDPALARLFVARSRAAHRDTAAALRASGNERLASFVGALRAERAQSEHEERWRAEEARAVGTGPRGAEPLASLEIAALRERDPERRAAFARAAADALATAASRREEAVEVRARARAEVGLAPDWKMVVEGDEVLAATEDGFRDVSAFLLRREPGERAGADPSRADLLRALALPRRDGLFRAGMLPVALKLTLDGLGVGGRVRIDDAERKAKWPGAHAVGARVSFRPRGGAGDWQDLAAAAGRALAAAARPPHARDDAFCAAVGWLLGSLLLEPRWLADRADVERRHARDVVRDLALRRLFALRADAAALRVASEVERGLSGAAWRMAHAEAMRGATGVVWEGVRACRDGEAARLAASLRGAAMGERLRLEMRERLDEDWWRNPRTAGHLAVALAAGAPAEAAEPPPAVLAASALARALER